MTDTLGRYANLPRISGDIRRARNRRSDFTTPVGVAVHPEWLATLGVPVVARSVAECGATLIETPPPVGYITSVEWPDGAQHAFCLGASLRERVDGAR